MEIGIEGVPPALAQADLVEGAVALKVDESLYPLDALYGAAFTFIDRFYVLLDRSDATRVRVTLAPKSGVLDAVSARNAVGEFANELLSCAWRHRIAQENRAVVEAVTMKALAGAAGPPSLDELSEFDFTEAPLEDPLGISMSWEEKYKGKKLGAVPVTEGKPEQGGD
ncbi:MAG TPA: His-Xaa-Ser system protein HxsD [Polyangiaceae bacterium]|nr:His-Xaa-Ser system protein HxsD [Polyangiaceae bacterium]